MQQIFTQLWNFFSKSANVPVELSVSADESNKNHEDKDDIHVPPATGPRESVIEGREKLIGNFPLLQATIDAVGDAIYVTDTNYHFVVYNQRFQEMWNISKEAVGRGDVNESIALIAEQLLAPTDLDKRSREIVDDVQHRSTELLHCKDGRTIERQSSPLSLEGVPPLRIWVLRDVTELENIKKATINLLEDLEDEKSVIEEKVQERTKELSEEHARFVASTSSIPLGLLVLDADNKILIKNRAVRAIFRIEKTDYTFEDIEHMIPDVNLSEKLSRCLSEHMPVEVKDVDVANKILRIMITPLGAFDEKSQETLGVVLLIEDTTEARALERGRDEFFAIASHELRTPLTAIRGNMSIIEDYYQGAITDKEVLEMIHDTNSAALRLITIVNDFLDVSRLEQGHITFQYSDFSAEELVNEVAQDLSEVAIAKGISIIVEKSDTALLVHADRDRSKQVLTNLVSNAINYSEHGTVKVSVHNADAQAEFLVRDEGVGITAQNQTLLFRKFQQAGTSVLTRDMTQSTGLGLYISRLIIEPMGGRIWLKSSVTGEGSVFAFTLPLTLEQAAK